MPRDLTTLIWEARRQVAFSNRAFARVTGVSLRTVERHASKGGVSASHQLRRLAAAVHPQNPALADELAQAAGTSLAELGLAPAPSASDARPEHADSVLLAAANALYLPPEAVRPAVAAAFTRALALGVSFGGLAQHLARPAPSAKPRGGTSKA